MLDLFFYWVITIHNWPKIFIGLDLFWVHRVNVSLSC
jgi:hypothetical protein